MTNGKTGQGSPAFPFVIGGAFVIRLPQAAGLATGQPGPNNGTVPAVRRSPQTPGGPPATYPDFRGQTATRSPPMNSYASLCDDFGVSTYLHGKLEMPSGRETVLHFFEAVQKAFPKMTDFDK